MQKPKLKNPQLHYNCEMNRNVKVMLKRFSDIIGNIIGIHPQTQSYLLNNSV